MDIDRWLPQPRLSLVLLVTWLLLQNSIASGHLVLGGVLALLIPLLTAAFWPEKIVIRKFTVLLGFALRVLWDIVVANFSVARLILSPMATLRPRFVELPLTLRNEFAIAILTNTISLTPGTVFAELSTDRKWLLVHCLDLRDEQAVIAQIRSRYEMPLREVFEAC